MTAPKTPHSRSISFKRFYLPRIRCLFRLLQQNHSSESLTGRVNTVDANVCPRHENLRLSDRLPKLARGLRCFCDGGYSMHWYLNDEVFPRRLVYSLVCVRLVKSQKHSAMTFLTSALYPRIVGSQMRKSNRQD